MTQIRKNYTRPLDLKNGRVDMAHGSGGRAMAQLISELFARHLGNEYLGQGDDGAVLPMPGEGKLVIEIQGGEHGFALDPSLKTGCL